MTKIYLIRHAEAEGNYFRRIQGQHNGSITARGQIQIAALAERFRDIHIDALYSSDLWRTMTTAGAITKYHQLSITPEPRLREMGMGVWEDLPWGNVEHDTPEQMFLFANDPGKFSVPKSESFEHLKTRISEVVLELAAGHPEQTIALVSHGMAIRSLIAKINNISSEEIYKIPHGDNTCVAELNITDGNFEVVSFNDNSHLSADTSTFANQTWWKETKQSDHANLRLLPMNLEADGELYKAAYADAWQFAHGSLKGFSPAPYLAAATKISHQHPRALMKAFSGEDFAGIVELDPDRLASKGCGWISFCYLVPEKRGQGLGVQLIGHAVSEYRALLRPTIDLHVAERNKSAIKIYEKLGFIHSETESGSLSPLWLMSKPIQLS
ncbi:MAG: bifunctional histidine phosphatase family protein/GNAT family N-acetyltransferase [Oscillospiraceae bacterium]